MLPNFCRADFPNKIREIGVSLYFSLSLSLSQTASSSGDPHVHIIRDVKSTDSGLYTCVAGNVLGQAQASAYLEVNSARRAQETVLLLTLCPSLMMILMLMLAAAPRIE